jgi:hypothetical protein
MNYNDDCGRTMMTRKPSGGIIIHAMIISLFVLVLAIFGSSIFHITEKIAFGALPSTTSSATTTRP